MRAGVNWLKPPGWHMTKVYDENQQLITIDVGGIILEKERRWRPWFASLLDLTDEELLANVSTSPDQEALHFLSGRLHCTHAPLPRLRRDC
jgi:hypothetical protein